MNMKTKHVVVVPYDEKWEQDFKEIAFELQDAIGELVLEVEHVGSTSVKGLSAKPIIDIDVVIQDDSVFGEVVSALAKIGYQQEGNLGIEGREAFRYDGKEHLRKHHLYVCSKNSVELHRHLVFRDYLREHPEAVKKYSKIKEDAAKRFPDSIDQYMAYKSSYIETVYRLIGL